MEAEFQEKETVAFFLLFRPKRIAAPIPPKPMMNSAQVAGSAVAEQLPQCPLLAAVDDSGLLDALPIAAAIFTLKDGRLWVEATGLTETPALLMRAV